MPAESKSLESGTLCVSELRLGAYEATQRQVLPDRQETPWLGCPFLSLTQLCIISSNPYDFLLLHVAQSLLVSIETHLYSPD